MKFALCNELCEGMPIEKVFDLAASLGYAGVEIAPYTLAENVNQISSARRREIVAAAKSSGVQVVGLHWLLVSPKGLHLNHPEDAYLRQQTVNYLVDQARFCRDVGGKIMVFGSPKQRSVVAGHSFAQAWEHTVDAFLRFLSATDDFGVTLCLEPLAPAETNFINTHEQAIRLVDTVGHPRLRMVLDVKAMSAESKPIPDIIRAARNHFVHFHANDPNLRGPGSGQTDFVPILRALNSVHYQGFVSVEVFEFKPDGPTIARDSIRYMQKCLAKA